jgi:hypothetical protein
VPNADARPRVARSSFFDGLPFHFDRSPTEEEPGRADGRRVAPQKKRLGNSPRASGSRTTCGIRSWISSGAGRRRPGSAPGGGPPAVELDVRAPVSRRH